MRRAVSDGAAGNEDLSLIHISNLLEGESFESLNIAPQYATVQDETISLLFSNGFSDYFRMGSDHLFRSDVYYDDYDSYYSVIYGSEYSAMDSAVSYAVRENGSSVYESLDSSSADAYVLCWGVRPDYPVDDALLRMNNWYFSMPVSYTHLDVYKRQLPDWRSGLSGGFGQKRLCQGTACLSRRRQRALLADDGAVQ